MVTPKDIVRTVKDLPEISYQKCPCGRCSDYHLVGIGSFVQGSGFTEAEAVLISGVLNIEREKMRKLTSG